jgi:hypothetical protein
VKIFLDDDDRQRFVPQLQDNVLHAVDQVLATIQKATSP